MKNPEDMKVGTIHKTNNCGEIEVIEYIDWRNVTVRFIKTGFITIAQTSGIRSGTVKDFMTPSVFGVGFLGKGAFKCSVNKEPTKEYKDWNNMLERCYSEKFHKNYPTYKGCSVCEEWHNFQVFAKWHKENCIEDYHLDKDIKIPGNKVYSPDTCMFVSPAENTIAATAKNYKFISPQGDTVEIYNLSEFCKENNLNVGHMSSINSGRLNQHKGWTKA